MYLYEEYAKRFLISSPIIKRCDKSVVFLRSNQILMIEKKLNFNQPDSYKLSICIPNKHNNHNFSFFKVLFCEEIEWNNYEKIILDLCAFTGASWFLISNLAVKNVLRLCNK